MLILYHNICESSRTQNLSSQISNIQFITIAIDLDVSKGRMCNPNPFSTNEQPSV